MKAKYRGRCPECDEQIEVGEDITYDVDDRIVHTRCEPSGTGRVKPSITIRTPRCPKCNLMHAGECF